jgi:hypothetical protein
MFVLSKHLGIGSVIAFVTAVKGKTKMHAYTLRMVTSVGWVARFNLTKEYCFEFSDGAMPGAAGAVDITGIDCFGRWGAVFKGLVGVDLEKTQRPAAVAHI